MIIFYKKNYQGALVKIEKLKKELLKKDEDIAKLQQDSTNKHLDLLCRLTTESNKNAKFKKDIEKLKELNNDLTIVNSDLNFKNQCLTSENRDLKKEISNCKRKITNLKKTRILKGTKGQNQIIKVKLGASTKSSVRNHIKNELNN